MIAILLVRHGGGALNSFQKFLEQKSTVHRLERTDDPLVRRLHVRGDVGMEELNSDISQVSPLVHLLREHMNRGVVHKQEAWA